MTRKKKFSLYELKHKEVALKQHISKPNIENSNKAGPTQFKVKNV